MKHRNMIGVASAAVCSHLISLVQDLSGALRESMRGAAYSLHLGAMGWLGELCTTSSNSEKVALRR